MKKLFKNSHRLLFAAMLIASMVAFSAFTAKEPVVVIWFELDEDGFVLGEKDPGTICDNGAEYCAVSVDSSELDSNGMPPFDNVEEPGASEHYIEIARKD